MIDTDGASQDPHIALMGNARQAPPPVWNPLVAAAMKASINTEAGFLQRAEDPSARAVLSAGHRALLRSFAILRDEDGHYGFLFRARNVF
jgi:hypothetical protein